MNLFNIFKRKPKTLADYHPDWLLWQEGDSLGNYVSGDLVFVSF